MEAHTTPSIAASGTPLPMQLASPPFVVHEAPPFNGYTFICSPTPWGFWTAVRKNPSIGEIVMQLGRRQNGAAHYTRGRLEVGWKKRVSAIAGTRFKAVFSAGPISLRPNGGFVAATVLLELRRVGDGRTFSAHARPVSHQQSILEVELPTTAQYDLKLTGILNSFYWGYANPYGEIIGRFDLDRIISRPIVDPGVDPQPLEAFQMSEEELVDKDALATVDEKAFAESEQYLEMTESEDPQELASQGETAFNG